MSGTAHQRIVAIDDQILFKVKIQRWRGAVWAEPEIPWLVAAGRRESGSADDFYAALAAEGVAARARYNARCKPPLATSTCTAHLLPDGDDRKRLQLEAGARLVRMLESRIPALLRQSLCDGHEHSAELAAFAVGVQVRADHGHETYTAVCVTGSVRSDLVTVILDVVPGCDRSGWYPEVVLPERQLRPNEQAWSNIMDAAAAAKLLGDG